MGGGIEKKMYFCSRFIAIYNDDRCSAYTYIKNAAVAFLGIMPLFACTDCRRFKRRCGVKAGGQGCEYGLTDLYAHGEGGQGA